MIKHFSYVHNGVVIHKKKKTTKKLRTFKSVIHTAEEWDAIYEGKNVRDRGRGWQDGPKKWMLYPGERIHTHTHTHRHRPLKKC